MKLIKQSKLFFKEGNSDKVYEIDLCELSPDAYLVNFRYGRRGATLKEGTKTPASVNKEEAEKLFASLENEKRKKGYQTETEVFVELPSLDEVKPDTIQGVIMHRLQNAVEGNNSFGTEWKTSRVIWKAGALGMTEAIPYIIKLATKGDELQVYSSLYALLKLRAEQATELFKSYATMAKQKQYIRNIATEALLTILDGEKRESLIAELLEKLPADVRYAIDANKPNELKTYIEEYASKGKLGFIPDFYLAYKYKPEALYSLIEIMKTWEACPPFFKQIRAVYKLAQVRGDMVTAAIMARKFETSTAMFNRTSNLDSEYGWQFITSLNESFVVGKEIRKEDSKLAYSAQTKKYLQRNSLNFIKDIGKKGDAKEYLQLAIATLLQYSDADYSEGGEKLVNNYGSYNWDTRDYHYLMINHAESSRSLMLLTILQGNDPTLILDKNMSYIYGKRYLKSRSYYYKENEVTEISRTGICGAPPAKREVKPPQDEKKASSIFGSIKSIFGGKKEEEKTLPKAETEQPQAEQTPQKPARLELYPEYWDAMPESYIMLLMKSTMGMVQKFAYENLTKHADFNELISRLDAMALLNLFDINEGDTKKTDYPAMLAMEVLKRKEDELKKDIAFVSGMLNSNYREAAKWAVTIVDESTINFIENFDFIYNLIFKYGKHLNHDWVDGILNQARLDDDRVKALLGKSVTALLQMEDTPENDGHFAQQAVQRLNIIAAKYYDKISNEIALQLFATPFKASKALGCFIIYQKSKSKNPEDVPFYITEMFLNNEIEQVRTVGKELLGRYPDNYIVKNSLDFFILFNTTQKDVLETVLQRTKQIINISSEVGKAAIYRLCYALVRKEQFEGAHAIIREFAVTDLRDYWNDLNPKDIITLIHANYRDSQLTAYEILKNYNKVNDFTLGQIISLGNHEILAIRQWCWKYFKDNVSRIRNELNKALGILDSKWDDTRAFAFHFFKTEFTEADWDADTLIGIVDSVRVDVEKFGKELITQYFKPENALLYLTKLSEHPSVAVQMFVSSYLANYAADNTEKIKELDFYFRSTLTRVNKGRVAKNRVFDFLKNESLKNEESARFIGAIMDDLSAQTTVQDKATCINILTAIKNRYPELQMHLTIIN